MSILKTDTTREQRFLLSNFKANKFPKQTQEDWKNGKIRFIDSDITHTSDISEGGGIFNLLTSTNDKEIGISDFDSNKLEAGVNVAVGRIKIGYGTATAGTSTAAAITYSSDISNFPSALLRAKLIIKQDNKVLHRIPIERFTVAAASQKVQGEEDVLHLGTPIVLQEQKPVDIQLEFSRELGMEAGTDDHFIQVRFIGTETAAR